MYIAYAYICLVSYGFWFIKYTPAFLKPIVKVYIMYCIYPVILLVHRKGIFLYIPAIFWNYRKGPVIFWSHRNRAIFGQHAGTGRPGRPPKGAPIVPWHVEHVKRCNLLPFPASLPNRAFHHRCLHRDIYRSSLSQSCRALSIMASANTLALVDRCPHEQTTT